MPKPVKLAKGKEFTFASVRGGGQPPKYPWDEWFNGELLLLEQSVGTKDESGVITEIAKGGKRDYELNTDQMPGKIKVSARRKYKVVQISRLDPDGKRLVDSLIIRARDMTPEERTAEDLQRAEEEQERAAKKAEKKAAKANPAPTATVQQETTDAA